MKIYLAIPLAIILGLAASVGICYVDSQMNAPATCTEVTE